LQQFGYRIPLHVELRSSWVN